MMVLLILQRHEADSVEVCPPVKDRVTPVSNVSLYLYHVSISVIIALPMTFYAVV